jgi:hypothetical protein
MKRAVAKACQLAKYAEKSAAAIKGAANTSPISQINCCGELSFGAERAGGAIAVSPAANQSQRPGSER